MGKSSKKKEIYTDIFNGLATITIYSDSVADISVLDFASIFDNQYPEVNISDIDIVKNELFIAFPIPDAWGQTEIKKVAEDVFNRI